MLERFLADLFNPVLVEYKSKQIKPKKKFSQAPENSFSFRNNMSKATTVNIIIKNWILIHWGICL